MRRGWPVVRREFTEMIRTKAYLVATVLGPFLIVLLMVAPLLFMWWGGGGQRDVLLLDATGSGVGRDVAALLENMDPEVAGRTGSRFTVETREVEGEALAERQVARERIEEGEEPLDGYLYLPPDFLDRASALYEGRNASSMVQMSQVRAATQAALQGRRMAAAGVDPQVISRVTASVDLEARKPGSDEGESEASLVLGFLLAMTVYFAVIMFATSVMRGVLEEKRDRVVEVLLSSIRARDLMVGKVFGIGAASLLQMLVWGCVAAVALLYGPAIAERYGASFPEIPPIPLSALLAFGFFFVTGFLLYAALFGAAGAMATSDHEANQMQFPVTTPLLIGLFMMYSLMSDPDNPIAVAGTLIPFTAPIVVPARALMTEIPPAQYVMAGALMIVTVVAVMWMAAKIYRIGVLSTGKKPTMKELVRWLRTA